METINNLIQMISWADFIKVIIGALLGSSLTLLYLNFFGGEEPIDESEKPINDERTMAGIQNKYFSGLF